jgi:hypothetical protein
MFAIVMCLAIVIASFALACIIVSSRPPKAKDDV